MDKINQTGNTILVKIDLLLFFKDTSPVKISAKSVFLKHNER